MRSALNARYRQEPIIGYKLAFSAPAAQQLQGLSEPAYGVLFAPMRKTDTVPSSAHVDLRLENEIGFSVGRDCTTLVPSVDAVRACFDAVFPAIECPDFNFASGSPVHGHDAIANNAYAAYCILGSPVALDAVDLTRITATLERQGEILDRGIVATSLDSAWQACLWLVNQLIHEGTPLRTGQIILTGALGKAVSATPGSYRADFGALGKAVSATPGSYRADFGALGTLQFQVT